MQYLLYEMQFYAMMQSWYYYNNAIYFTCMQSLLHEMKKQINIDVSWLDLKSNFLQPSLNSPV